MRNSSGSLAMLAAARCISSRVSSLGQCPQHLNGHCERRHRNFLLKASLTQTASPCGTFSQFQSGPKPQLAEFGNRAANRRTITATAAQKTSAIRSRRLIGANGRIFFPLTINFFALSKKAVLCTTAKARDDVRFGSKTDIPACSADVRFAPESGHW